MTPIILLVIVILLSFFGGFGFCFYKYRQWKQQNLELQMKFNSLNEVSEKKLEDDEKGLKNNNDLQ